MNDILIKIIAVVIVSALFVILIRNYSQEYSFVLVLAVLSGVLIYLLAELSPQLNKIKVLFESSGNSMYYFATALKALGISYISGFASDVCRDFGQTALASIADIAGKCAIFILSIPLMCAVLEAALGFADL